MQMNTRTIYAVLLLTLTATACEEESSLEIIDELSVQALLHADAPVDSVQFSRVIPFTDSLSNPQPADLLPVIYTEDDEVYSLTYLGADGYYGNSELIVSTGQTYRLEVDYNGKTVSAETFIPSPPQDVWFSDTIVRKDKINDFTDILDQVANDPVEITWEGEGDAYYFVLIENIEEDPEPVNELFEENGFERPTILTEPSTNTFYNIDAFRDLTHYGTHRVTIYRVNPEYVTLYSANTSGNGALNEIRTNVDNGFGIFSGVNSLVAFIEVVKS